MHIFNKLWNDENGFLVSAEVVLVGTILIIAMIVGHPELSFNVNQELEDVGAAIAGINQTYYYTLAAGRWSQRGICRQYIPGLRRRMRQRLQHHLRFTRPS